MKIDLVALNLMLDVDVCCACTVYLTIRHILIE